MNSVGSQAWQQEHCADPTKSVETQLAGQNENELPHSLLCLPADPFLDWNLVMVSTLRSKNIAGRGALGSVLAGTWDRVPCLQPGAFQWRAWTFKCACYVCFVVGLEMTPRVSHMPGKHPAFDLHPQSWFTFLFGYLFFGCCLLLFETVSVCSSAGLETPGRSTSLCFLLLDAGIIGVHHHTQLLGVGRQLIPAVPD